MGLSDVLNGMRNGPRGGASTSTSGSSGGMSPITMGLLALLAYKALKGSGVLGTTAAEQPANACRTDLKLASGRRRRIRLVVRIGKDD